MQSQIVTLRPHGPARAALRADPQRTRTPGAPNLLAIILLEMLGLLAHALRPTAELPEHNTLLTFLAGNNFDLPEAFAAQLRPLLTNLLFTIPPPKHARTHPRRPPAPKSVRNPRHAHRHAKIPTTAPARHTSPQAGHQTGYRPATRAPPG